MKAALAILCFAAACATVSAQHADLLGLNLPDFEVVDTEGQVCRNTKYMHDRHSASMQADRTWPCTGHTHPSPDHSKVRK